MRLRFTFASRRALSSVGQSRRLIISWSQVQALQGAQFGEVNRLQNASACVSLPSVSTEAELRRAFSSAGSERSPHTREVTGSSPVLPTTLKSPARKCGVFCWFTRQGRLNAGSQNKPSGPRPQGFLRVVEASPRVSTERSEVVQYGSRVKLERGAVRPCRWLSGTTRTTRPAPSIWPCDATDAGTRRPRLRRPANSS